MAVMRCTVATPTRALFEGEITYAGIPGTDGAYGVLPGHELIRAACLRSTSARTVRTVASS